MKEKIVVKQSAINAAVVSTLAPTVTEESTVGAQTWEELDYIYQSSAEFLYTIMANITAIVETASAIDKVKTDETIGFVVKSISLDSNKFSKDLIAIKERHQEYKGKVGDDNEYMLYLGLFQDYVNVNTVMRSVTLEPMMIVADFLETLGTEKSIEAAKQKEAADAAKVVDGEVVVETTVTQQ
jgi:hypothetical protein